MLVKTGGRGGGGDQGARWIRDLQSRGLPTSLGTPGPSFKKEKEFQIVAFAPLPKKERDLI